MYYYYPLYTLVYILFDILVGSFILHVFLRKHPQLMRLHGKWRLIEINLIRVCVVTGSSIILFRAYWNSPILYGFEECTYASSYCSPAYFLWGGYNSLGSSFIPAVIAWGITTSLLSRTLTPRVIKPGLIACFQTIGVYACVRFLSLSPLLVFGGLITFNALGKTFFLQHQWINGTENEKPSTSLTYRGRKDIKSTKPVRKKIPTQTVPSQNYICPACQTSVDDTANYCPYCGDPLTVERVEVSRPNRRQWATLGFLIAILACLAFFLIWEVLTWTRYHPVEDYTHTIDGGEADDGSMATQLVMSPIPILMVAIGIVIVLITNMLTRSEFRSLILHRSGARNSPGPHRLTMDEVFENENRKRIIDAVLADPGIHFNELSRQCDLVPGQLEWHLDVLTSYGVITKRSVGQYVVYIPVFPRNPLDNLDLALAKSKTTLQVFRVIENMPGITATEIARDLEMAKSSVKYHVDKLQENGLITSTRNGRRLELRTLENPPSNPGMGNSLDSVVFESE